MAREEVPTFNFTFLAVSLKASRAGYGLQICGDSPVCISDVLPGSVAAQAGARAGDYVIVFNGRDVQFSSNEDLGIMLQDSYGAALQLRVARPNPLPSGDLGRRRALLTLQTMLRTGDYVTTGNEVDEYKKKVGSALADVDDILGGFQLPGDQHVPTYGGSEQEVEISMYETQELESPPSSQDSEPASYDPLLDFSDDTQFTAIAAKGMKGNMADIESQIQKMSELMRDVKTNKAKKQTQQSSSYSFSPKASDEVARQITPQQSSRNKTVTQTNRELDELEEQLKWVQSPLPKSTSAPVPTSPNRAVSPPAQKAKETKKKKFGGIFRRSKSPEEVSKTSEGMFRKTKSPDRTARFGPEPTGHVQEPRKGNKSFQPQVVSSTTTTSRGLPNNVSEWEKEAVGQWLRGFSKSLYALYYPLFSRHQITGRSLLRLNDSKLKSMGITNPAHCRTLATEIARLKIQQEQAELRQFQTTSSHRDPSN